MKMKKLAFASMTALLSTGLLIGCSSDDEDQDDPATEDSTEQEDQETDEGTDTEENEDEA
ncbi:iron ABC transporter substrate-binding protein [Oceanobacillus picturae]|uniref:Iron ABC transporter substrate-binding protein n=2 Tax=Oceanobacillus picturae TaxID=171693 RepID=A0A0U9H538_9BACI|nr:iron ABC transporter substrate-binding protein [Oceanobacillus picturae]